jgi:hypothetical protein
MGLTLKATPPTNEMMQDLYLQISITYILYDFDEPFFFMHKFSMCFFEVIQSHHEGCAWKGAQKSLSCCRHT